ncbi:hypothetical protein CEXT_411751 [Caerostris extrusa]|uniref:Uncharacterized protein n=1 Tax=Caerostris extrusa TaxID=172846 RepID=A0AAV4TCW0_CAEEX|nr:hypothetical protein CEXT_411751 [Caerostris extrusa]
MNRVDIPLYRSSRYLHNIIGILKWSVMTSEGHVEQSLKRRIGIVTKRRKDVFFCKKEIDPRRSQSRPFSSPHWHPLEDFGQCVFGVTASHYVIAGSNLESLQNPRMSQRL